MTETVLIGHSGWCPRRGAHGSLALEDSEADLFGSVESADVSESRTAVKFTGPLSSTLTSIECYRLAQVSQSQSDDTGFAIVTVE